MMMKGRIAMASVAIWALLAFAIALPAFAIDPVELPDPQLQARYIALTHEFRCVQCQNETLADSEVDVAGELRREIRNMLLAGKSDDQIRDFMVSRYSEFILFRPRYSARNAWLWLSPVVLLLIGAVVAMRIVRARAAFLAEDTEPVRDDSDSPPRNLSAGQGAPRT
jgi:cytochrome c-type biogenesis protein CcmH